MSESRRATLDRITREDLVMFINACFACTGQREFYGDSVGQAVSIRFLHEYILINYRRLYARTLAAGINHFNQAQIIVNLLATGRDTPVDFRSEENALIRAGLGRLPPQRALRALETLRRRGVNNRRARATVRDYLASRPDPAFDAVKYRGKLRALATHAHLKLGDERTQFLFRGWKARVYETEIFEQFRAAHHSAEAVYSLPFTVAEGLARKHKIPRDRFLERIQGKMTNAERLRMQASAAQAGGQVDVELSRIPLTKLASYLLSLSREERTARRADFAEAFSVAAARIARKRSAKFGRVAAVLDRSHSTSGSSEKRRRPLAVALAVSQLLQAASSDFRALWCPPIEDELLVAARGQTGLADAVIDALEWGADLVVIVSDGFENDPPGATSEVVRVFRERFKRQSQVSIVHLNPVFDAEDYAPKALGPALPTVGLRNAADLLTMLGFARFAEGTEPLSSLEDYLEARVSALLGKEAA